MDDVNAAGSADTADRADLLPTVSWPADRFLFDVTRFAEPDSASIVRTSPPRLSAELEPLGARPAATACWGRSATEAASRDRVRCR